ncbi:MAG: N-acetylmuramoyl-L-alanine amidase [Clostridia bacterium]|nr:N-acetylmuramoyl-L-alanine amidase [Clostridia bacterium]
MQNKNKIPQRRTVLPCTVYEPLQKKQDFPRPQTNKKLCFAVIALLLIFAAVILIVSAVKGPREQNDLPVFLNIDKNLNELSSPDKTSATVCIDPGHGYDDPGALSIFTNRYEKDLNLEISLILAERLEEMGYDVIMTRDSDLPPETLEPNATGLYLMNPNKRTEFVRNSETDVFVSIHCNALENAPEVSGTKLYYYGPSNPLTLKYANVLSGNLRSAFPERSVEAVGTDFEDSLAVNRDVFVPSVLVEVGYMTSPSDCALLCNEDWCRNFAYALADGIDEFITNKK